MAAVVRDLVVRWRLRCLFCIQVAAVVCNAVALSQDAGPTSYPAMLRSTNRLGNELCYLNYVVNYAVDIDNVRQTNYCTSITEAEFDSSASLEAFGKSPEAGARGSVFDYSMLNRLTEDDTKYGYDFIKGGDRRISERSETRRTLCRRESVDILWVSPTEFVTKLAFDDHESFMEHLFAVSVCASNAVSSIQAYRVVSLEKDVRTALVPPGEMPLRFLSNLLKPISDMVTQIEFTFTATPPVEATLSLIPTSAQSMKKNLLITLADFRFDYSYELLQALSSHPIHSHVRLQLKWCFERRVSPLELNDVLLQFQYPVHLQVPNVLFNLDIAGKSFTANPAFESLAIAAQKDEKISPKLLDDIACGSVKHLTMGSSEREWTCHDSQVDLACRVISGRASGIQSLTLVSTYNFFSRQYEAFEDQQEAFDKLSKVLDSSSTNQHSLSSLRFAFPNSRRQMFINSNDVWDSRFSPALVLNWLSRHNGNRPSLAVSGLALEKINQGHLYRCATNLMPADLSASSASAIFHVLQCGMTGKEHAGRF
jgi:hypothetical protein